jgi:hypothetical protein
LTDGTTPQGREAEGMWSELPTTRLQPRMADHSKWSDGLWVDPALLVANAFTGAVSWAGSLSLQPCDRSEEMQDAQLQ